MLFVSATSGCRDAVFGRKAWLPVRVAGLRMARLEITDPDC